LENNDAVLYQKAKERVNEIKGFYSHLFVYVLVNAVIFAINYLTSPGVWWFYWPLLGWGIGIIAHAIGVFGFFGIMSQEWEERKIEEIVASQKRKSE
jgi:hypothetical protein